MDNVYGTIVQEEVEVAGAVGVCDGDEWYAAFLIGLACVVG